MPARITMTSRLTGRTRTLEIPQYEQDEFDRRYHAWKSGDVLIQDIFWELSSNAREFILSGITQTEWDEYFGKIDANTKPLSAS
jgi:hypothetical protein